MTRSSYEGAVAHAATLTRVGEVTFATVVDGAHMLPFAAPKCFVRIVSGLVEGRALYPGTEHSNSHSSR